MTEVNTEAVTVEHRWIVRYRRYRSDSWSEESFTSERAAKEFARNKYNYMQTDAQVQVKHFVKA